MSPKPKLSPKQELFCLEYLKDLNATQAAIRAKYSKNTAKEIGANLLSKVNIQFKIASLNAKRFNKVEQEGMDVIRELALLSFSDVKDYLEIAEGGEVTVKTFEQMKGSSSRAIASIKEKRVIRESKDGSEAQIIDSTLEFKLWDKNKALDNLGRHHKLFTDKLEIKESKYKDVTDDELDAQIEQMMEK